MLSAAPRVDIGRETLSYQCSPGSRIESWPALFSNPLGFSAELPHSYSGRVYTLAIQTLNIHQRWDSSAQPITPERTKQARILSLALE